MRVLMMAVMEMRQHARAKTTSRTRHRSIII